MAGENARQAQVHTEKSGVNQIVVDSAADIKGVARNCIFAGAVHGTDCTAPQNVYVPRKARYGGGTFVSSIRSRKPWPSVQKLLGDPARAVGTGRGGQRAASLRHRRGPRPRPRVARQPDVGPPRISASHDTHAALVKLDAKDGDKYLKEWFGHRFVIATDSTAQSLDIAGRAVRDHGALTLSVYSTDAKVIDDAIAVAEDAGVALSINLTGGVFVNQSAAFSDFHGTGANPAANASLTDAAFVSNRFRVVQHRMHVSA
jgi:hypothetical protein